MKTKATLKIDKDVLKPSEDIAWILGISVSEYQEEKIASLNEDLQELETIAEEVEHLSYRSKRVAEAIAERFELFAIEKKLEGRDYGTLTARVVKHKGHWSVRADYLSPKGKKWQSLSVVEDWER